MPTIGVMTTEFDGATLDEVADQVVQHGITSVQLQLGSAVPDVPKTDALLRGLDVLGEHLSENLAVHAHSVFAARGIDVAAVDGTYNMIDSDPDRRRRNLAHLVRLIELAHLFGTELVTLCTGSRHEIMWFSDQANSSDSAWVDLLEQMRVAAGAAEAANIRLAFEPEYNNVVNSARQARRLIDEVASPALKVLMDGANIFHGGDLDRQREHLAEAFELVGRDIALAHAKDLDHDGDAGGRAAGMGQLDYTFYLAQLQQHGYQGSVVLHQLKELAPDHLDRGFQHVRDHAPAGYFN